MNSTTSKLPLRQAGQDRTVRLADGSDLLVPSNAAIRRLVNGNEISADASSAEVGEIIGPHPDDICVWGVVLS